MRERERKKERERKPLTKIKRINFYNSLLLFDFPIARPLFIDLTHSKDQTIGIKLGQQGKAKLVKRDGRGKSVKT